VSSLTIVLPLKNSAKHLSSFLDSLKKQDNQDFILSIVDGTSADNTLETIKKYNFNLKIISRKDISAEDRMNKFSKK